ncbi:MAG: hypothetical protein GX595_15615 [Lentisphaerae bacterium]|nr:hypothetical protein [Lentisphaerota bacterium]
MHRSALPELPFEHFLSFAEVTGFVEALASAAGPDLVELSRLGLSREGRALHLLTITDRSTGPASAKPAYLIHGNIHAAELSGTHAALYTARKLLADHREGRSDLLREMAFYIIPRINPDGAEFVVGTSGSVRSRTDRSRRVANTLYQEDVDGNGLILSMRQEHPDGPYALDPEDPRLLVQRTVESRPPFYRVYPEGRVHAWDGSDAIAVEGRGFDWNRNWSFDWRPEPEQWGAGDFPFSEPEMRALAEFLHGRPNLFAVLGYHTGPNAVLRPPSTGSDGDLDGGDVAMMHELAEMGSARTGFPVVPVVKYHVNRVGQKDINLRGHFHNFGYHHLGLFVFEFELGTLVNSAGVTTEEVFATKNQQEYEAVMRRVLSWWDRQDPSRRDPLFHPWTPYEHPQLGRVEIGGMLQRHLAGPTLSELATISAATYEFTLAHAACRPVLSVEEVTAEVIEGPIRRLRLRVANRGRFPTHISAKGRSLRRLQPVRVEFTAGPGVERLSREGHSNLGHLGGLTDSRVLEWFLRVPEGAGWLCEVGIDAGTAGRRRLRIAADGTVEALPVAP